MIDIDNIVDELSMFVLNLQDDKHLKEAHEDAKELQRLLSTNGSQADKQKRVDELKKIIGA